MVPTILWQTLRENVCEVLLGVDLGYLDPSSCNCFSHPVESNSIVLLVELGHGIGGIGDHRLVVAQGDWWIAVLRVIWVISQWYAKHA